MNYQKVKYKLTNNDTKISIWLENDPKNWDKSARTLKRDSKTFGVYTELSKNLEFVLDGADFLTQAYTFKGGEADVTLYEYRFNPNTSHPYLNSTGTLNFSKYQRTDLGVKVPFKTGGLSALIKSQQKEKFEIERLESINGNVIDAIDKKTVALTSRDILLITQFEVEEDKKAFVAVESNSGGIRDQTTAIPLYPISKSHEEAQYVLEYATGSETVGNAGMMVFLQADRTRTLKINLTVNFDAFVQQYEQVQWAFYQICLTTYKDGNIFNLKDRIVLSDLSDRTEYPNQGFGSRYENISGFTVPMSATYNGTITLEDGDSLAVDLLLKSNMQKSNLAGVRVESLNIVSSLVIEEDSFFQDTQAQSILLKDAYEKVMQIITGEKGRFYSDFYTNETFKLTALTTGFWIRQFNYIIETIDDKEVPKYGMQISLDDLLNTTNAIHNTGYHIETIKGKETLVVEDLKYYFQQATAIQLGEVSDLEEENADDFCHSSLEFGYKKGGDYEEAMGLDEYNIKTGFTTPLKRVETKYSKVSTARADKYAQEFARRKPKLTHGTTDTPYDKDLHLLDLKLGLGNALEERDYNDDFEVIPTGVYSPETATNLRLTPSQIEKRHEWFYGAGVIKHQDDKIRYSNTGGNNGLTTKEVGKNARSERDDININELEKARFEPIWYTFTHPFKL